VLLALGFGCDDDPPTRDCGDQDPTYSLRVNLATGEPLPADTTVTVTYGGDNSETYSLAEPNETHQVLFCSGTGSTLSGGAGNGGQGGVGPGGPTELTCELWIEGGVAIEVQSAEFGRFEVGLAPESDDCGPLTVEEEVVMGSVEEED
jgi:hypothetical protein